MISDYPRDLRAKYVASAQTKKEPPFRRLREIVKYDFLSDEGQIAFQVFLFTAW